MLSPSRERGPPRIQFRARRGPVTLVARMIRSLGLPASHAPTMLSVRLQVSARGGTGYISAVSMKLTPRSKA